MGSFKSDNHHFCDNCLFGFKSKARLRSHIDNCKFFNPTKIIMPSKDILKFDNYKYTLKFPFIIYCDFESVLIKNDLKIGNKTKVTETS